MKLFCDANVGTTLAQALTSAGHDVARVAVDLPGASDQVVFGHAVAADRVLLTCDRDFGQLVFQHGAAPPRAIVYIRFEPDDVRTIIPRLLPIFESDELLGHLTVLEQVNTRRRPFPQRGS